jgi:hypothetical protein
MSEGISSAGDLDQILKLGTLEYLDILTLTLAPSYIPPGLVTKPPVPVLRRLFKAYRKAFFNYSEQFILYYLYKMDQVRLSYTIEELFEVMMDD